MKLFDTFEAVKFPEEDMIFITRGGYLYYIYNPKYKWWRKHCKPTVSAQYSAFTRKRKVAAYARVSTAKEEQETENCHSSFSPA